MANFVDSTVAVISSVTLVATTTTVTSSPDPSASGEAVTLTATVDPSDGGGTVAFKNGSADITGRTAQELTLSTGKYQATCTTSALPTGPDKITAAYSGDAAYAGSASDPLTQTVLPATTTTVFSSRNPSFYGQPVTFTAVVRPTDGGGTVAFRNGSADHSRLHRPGPDADPRQLPRLLHD